MSRSFSIPVPFVAETSTVIVSPPYAAVFLRGEALLLELALHAHRVGGGKVALVDRDEDRGLRGPGVADRLQRLRHEAVVRRDDEDDHVRDARPAGSASR